VFHTINGYHIDFSDILLDDSFFEPIILFRYTGTPVFPFGYGLSYTEFSYAWFNPQPSMPVFYRSIEENMDEYDIDKIMEFAESARRPNKYYDVSSYMVTNYAVNVTNTGRVASDVSVLLFIDASGAGGPPRKLIDYDRLPLVKPGETRTVTFALSLSAFSIVLENGHRVVTKGEFPIYIGDGGRQESSIQLLRTIRMVGEDYLTDEFPQPPAEFSREGYQRVLQKIMQQ
jgi:hypothetical protein